jgi:hypothetical protein
MIRKTFVAAAAALALSGALSPAFAGISVNGIGLNGVNFNGTFLNGTFLNGAAQTLRIEVIGVELPASLN